MSPCHPGCVIPLPGSVVTVRPSADTVAVPSNSRRPVVWSNERKFSFVPGAAPNVFGNVILIGAVITAAPGAWMVMSNVERVLQEAGGEHVADQLRRHGADADLRVRQWLAVKSEDAAGLHFQRQLLPLLLGQVRGGNRIDANVRDFGCAHVLQQRSLQTGQDRKSTV